MRLAHDGTLAISTRALIHACCVGTVWPLLTRETVMLLDKVKRAEAIKVVSKFGIATGGI